MLYFITGNKDKLREVKAILDGVVEVEQLDIDLPEEQGMDSHFILGQKLREAFSHTAELDLPEGHDGFIVEDVSFSMDCLDGFPGPLIKWFLNTVGTQKMYDIADKLGNYGAEAKAMLGYAKEPEDVYFFEGVVKGRMAPRVEANGFGFDKVFIPEGYEKRYSEMEPEEKNKISHRRLALNELKKFLEQNKPR